MNDRVRQLQLRIRALHRGHAVSQVRYPDDLRAEIIAVARAGRTAGRSLARLAREIGVSAPTLLEPGPTGATGEQLRQGPRISAWAVARAHAISRRPAHPPR